MYRLAQTRMRGFLKSVLSDALSTYSAALSRVTADILYSSTCWDMPRLYIERGRQTDRQRERERERESARERARDTETERERDVFRHLVGHDTLACLAAHPHTCTQEDS